MSLTEDQITAGATYVVRIDKQALSFKRGNDAAALAKGINGRPVGLVYAPQDPQASRTGYLEVWDEAASAYDPASRSWTVTIPAGGGRPLADLRALAAAYGAEVTRAGDEAPAPAPATPAPSPRRAPGTAERAEYGCGFGPDELAAMSGQTRRAIAG